MTSTEIDNDASLVRWIRSAALTLLLVGCPDEPKPQVGGTDTGLTPISHTTTTATTSSIDPKKHVVEPPPPSAGGCATAPKWVSQPPCVRDGFLYAAGEFKAQSGTFLARGTAANRARKRLALAMGAHENDTVKLEGSEIDQVYVCESTVHALARIKHKGGGELRTCGADTIAQSAAAKGCPKWTARMSWQDGETLYGVAPTVKVMKRLQADQAAVNRARQVVAEMVEVELQLSPDGVTTMAKPTPLQELRRSTAECGGARWMLVAFQKGGSDSRSVRAPVLRGPTDKMGIK